MTDPAGEHNNAASATTVAESAATAPLFAFVERKGEALSSIDLNADS